MFLCLNEMTEVAMRVADVPARPYSPDVLAGRDAPKWSDSGTRHVRGKAVWSEEDIRT